MDGWLVGATGVYVEEAPYIIAILLVIELASLCRC